MSKRPVKAVIISDLHLGIYGSKAVQVYNYLKSIQPEWLILNGDIFDGWRFSPNYFPADHLRVVRYLLKMAESGVKIVYIPGNHDEIMRRFVGTDFGLLKVVNKFILELNGTSTWIFHGDVFDVVMHHSKWLAKMGARGYGMLTWINRLVNKVLVFFGRNKISLAGKIKDKVKGGSKDEVSKFESTVSGLAIRKGYHYVVCGHIHRPVKKRILTPKGSVTYLNSGDWVDNMTSLEYINDDWQLMYWNDEGTESTTATTEQEYIAESTEDAFLRAFRDVLRS